MNAFITALVAVVACGVAATAVADTRTVTTTVDRETRTQATARAPAPDAEVHRDDATLAQRIRNELELTFGEDAREVRVEVRDGVVFLSGLIPTEGHRRQVHDLVHDVAGVKGLELQGLEALTYFDERSMPE
jgi:osmotically-inducible protein OsmY